jgi:UDP-N-acetylglucosamine transferase subunit ALG13
MIFVSLGTEVHPFVRFLQELENLIRTLGLKEDFIVQQGYTNYSSTVFEAFKFVDNTEFIEYIRKADIIITHAGSGALFNAIRNGKKVIAVARLKKYHEMVDDHQTELVKKLSQDGYIIDGTYSLIEAWKKVETFLPKSCDFPNAIVVNLKKYIDTYC